MVAIEKKSDRSESSSDDTATSTGQLIIIGGSEDKEGDCTILREFVRRAGGRDSKIVVMTVATGFTRRVRL